MVKDHISSILKLLLIVQPYWISTSLIIIYYHQEWDDIFLLSLILSGTTLAIDNLWVFSALPWLLELFNVAIGGPLRMLNSMHVLSIPFRIRVVYRIPDATAWKRHSVFCPHTFRWLLDVHKSSVVSCWCVFSLKYSPIFYGNMLQEWFVTKPCSHKFNSSSFHHGMLIRAG